MTFRRKVGGTDARGVFSAQAARLCFPGAAPLRLALFRLLALLASAASAHVVLGQHGHASAPPPPPPQPHVAAPAPRGPEQPGYARPNSQPKPAGQQHLNEWLRQNQGISTQEQISRLQREPGFNRLPPDQQRRLVQRLRQVDQMPPEQRRRVLEHIENMERLSPPQQQAVRWSASRLGQLPPSRQQAVREAIRSLRDVPPPYRQAQLYSPRYAAQLTPEERGIVGNLLMVESYHSPDAPPPR